MGATWLYPNWDYASNGRFNGRWDDPNGSYRVRYGALEPEGALVEALQRYRADKDIVVEQLEIEGGESWFDRFSRFRGSTSTSSESLRSYSRRSIF